MSGSAAGTSGFSSAETPPKSCAEYLAQPIVLGLINVVALNAGAARVLACEKIPPFVHIVYVLLNDKRINFSIPCKTSGVGTGNGPYLSLQRITTFGAASSNALINGFTWEGDKGFSEGAWGKALGIVRSNSFALGNNTELGGVTCANCTADGLKFVMAFSGAKVNPAFLSRRSFSDIGAFSRNVAGTSTSVISNGICQTPGGTNRWSAVGNNEV